MTEVAHELERLARLARITDGDWQGYFSANRNDLSTVRDGMPVERYERWFMRLRGIVCGTDADHGVMMRQRPPVGPTYGVP